MGVEIPKPLRKRDEILAGLKTHATPIEYTLFRFRWWFGFLAFVLALLWSLPRAIEPNLREERGYSGVQAMHAVGLALYSYAQDHKNQYPAGKSSTEVFQKLIDESYITDPMIFYAPMPGKTAATGKLLRPENVCFDYTLGVQPGDTNGVPLVFSTGCKLDYASGKKIHVSENSPYGTDGVAVFFDDEMATFISVQDGSARVFSPDYKPKGRTYVQLTPEGRARAYLEKL